MSRIPVIVLLASLAAPWAEGADIIAWRTEGELGAVGYEATVVWGAGEYLLDLWARTDRSSTNFARNRQATESALELRREAVFLQSVLGLPVNSRETVSDRVRNDPDALVALKRLVERAEKRVSALTVDMDAVRLRYVIPLWGAEGLLSVFAPRGNPTPLDRYLGFAPAAAYTGLVVVVQGTKAAYGRSGADATLKACLLPRIYDTDLKLVLDPAQVDRTRLLEWGVVAYTNDLDELDFTERVGTNPLRTVARGVYGTRDTDIVISRDMARLLLSREENLALLREGRILVILDAPTAPPREETPPEGEMQEIGPAGGTG